MPLPGANSHYRTEAETLNPELFCTSVSRDAPAGAQLVLQDAAVLPVRAAGALQQGLRVPLRTRAPGSQAARCAGLRAESPSPRISGSKVCGA